MELSQINCDFMYDLIKHYNSNKKEINKTIEKILSKGVLEMGDEVTNLKIISRNIVVQNIV